MLGSFFVTVNQWISEGHVLAAAGSFVWGAVSVLFSPCHLASIPLIVAYVGGQDEPLRPRQAAWYAGAFSLGLFITIAVVGLICVLLGRMLGDVGVFFPVLVGVVLIWVAMGMLGVGSCSMSGNMLQRVKVRGIPGAFILGLAYGVLSGTCTFGFIAPILAVITVHNQFAAGLFYIILFAIGHCIPIAMAGSSTALVRRLLQSGGWQGTGIWFRKGAGLVIATLGAWFVLSPFVGIS